VPDYADIDRQPGNQLIMALFRGKMAQAVGQDSALPG
jgi:hypothetical protein